MPKPLLPLRPSPEATLADAIEEVLRSDPDLKRVVRTWRTFDGSPGDEDKPTLSQLPYLQLATESEPSGWFSEGQHTADFGIAIAIVVEGTHRNDLLNLWHAIRTALFPPEGTARRDWVDARLSGLCVNGKLSAPALDAKQTDAGVRQLFAAGKLSLRLNVTT